MVYKKIFDAQLTAAKGRLGIDTLKGKFMHAKIDDLTMDVVRLTLAHLASKYDGLTVATLLTDGPEEVLSYHGIDPAAFPLPSPLLQKAPNWQLENWWSKYNVYLDHKNEPVSALGNSSVCYGEYTSVGFLGGFGPNRLDITAPDFEGEKEVWAFHVNDGDVYVFNEDIMYMRLGTAVPGLITELPPTEHTWTDPETGEVQTYIEENTSLDVSKLAEAFRTVRPEELRLVRDEVPREGYASTHTYIVNPENPEAGLYENISQAVGVDSENPDPDEAMWGAIHLVAIRVLSAWSCLATRLWFMALHRPRDDKTGLIYAPGGGGGRYSIRHSNPHIIQH